MSTMMTYVYARTESAESAFRGVHGDMEAANRSEAERCLRLAREARARGEAEKARKLAQKSLRLSSTQRAQDFLSELENSEASSGPGKGEERGAGGGGEGVRRRGERGGGAEAAPEPEVADYTPEQKEAVDNILRCKDYYEILGVPRTATEADLKKQYRKLALQLHPDKNRAPKADEAFKAVSNAYGVLNDKDKRSRYDRFGEDGIRPSGRSSHRHYYADTDAEELFRTFFGANFTFDDMFMTPYASNRRQTRHHHRFTNQTRREPVSGWVQLFQLLPVLFILFLSVFSTFIFPLLHSPPYLFYSSGSHSIVRYTKQHHITYYVKDSFTREYPSPEAIRRLEREILSEKKWLLRSECQEARLRQGVSYSRRQKKENSEKKVPKSCQELQKLMNG